MNNESIRNLLTAQPFVMFEVRMTNGDQHTIRHPGTRMVGG